MSRMSELDLIIREQVKPIHTRLLEAQKDIKQLKDAAYADHRLIEKLGTRLDAQHSIIKRLEANVQRSTGIYP